MKGWFGVLCSVALANVSWYLYGEPTSPVSAHRVGAVAAKAGDEEGKARRVGGSHCRTPITAHGNKPACAAPINVQTTISSTDETAVAIESGLDIGLYTCLYKHSAKEELIGIIAGIRRRKHQALLGEPV